MIENENALGNKNRRLLEHWVFVYIILDFQIWFLNPKIFRSIFSSRTKFIIKVIHQCDLSGKITGMRSI